MREVELQFDASTPVWCDALSAPVTGATVKLYDAKNAVLATVAATPSAAATVTTEGTSSTILVLDDVTGVTVGEPLIIYSHGTDYTCTPARIDGSSVTLVTGLPVKPDDGSSVYGVRAKAMMPAQGVARIGSNYRLVWQLESDGASLTTSQPASVVRWVWTPVCSASDVRDVLSELNQSRAEQWCQAVADRVDEVVQARLLATGKRPWLYLSSTQFADVARTGIRYELSQRGIAFGGQIYEAQRELRFAMDDKLTQIVTGLQGILDANNDGVIDPNEANPQFYRLRAIR